MRGASLTRRAVLRYHHSLLRCSSHNIPPFLNVTPPTTSPPPQQQQQQQHQAQDNASKAGTSTYPQHIQQQQSLQQQQPAIQHDLHQQQQAITSSPQAELPNQETAFNRETDQLQRFYTHDYTHEIGAMLQEGGVEAAIEKKIAAKYQDVSRIPMINTHDIFANSDVKLSEINVYGFDYDYTLAQYTPKIQNEIYEMALKVLVNEHKYPPELINCKYDQGFAIRGLQYDIDKGYLLKFDFLRNIQIGAIYFGRNVVSKEEALERYGSLQLLESYADANLRNMSDIFCLPEACLISDVINFLTQANYTFEPHIIYDDVTRAVNTIHRNGTLHDRIMRDIHKYLEGNPALGKFLENLRNAGKKIFMLTNSPFSFADVGMKYMLKGHLPPGVHRWTELFDLVITQCDKPNFFGRGRSFRKLDLITGRLYWDKINSFEPGQVYVGGSLNEFTRITGWKGNSVLYFGDHLFSDLMEPSVREGWRTGVIIRELETEVGIQNSPDYRKKLSELLAIEELMVQCQTYSGREYNKDQVLRRLKERRYVLRQALKEPFNKHFGSVFRTHNNPTMFAHGLQQYADLYTCKIENFLACPLDFSFYPVRNFLPHEFKLN